MQNTALGTRVHDLARERRPDDPLLATFLDRYYQQGTGDDEQALDDAYARAVAHYHFGYERAVDETLVQVVNPRFARDGWDSDRTILMFVTDDVPFLVDTVRIVLDRHGLGIHFLVHPMLGVQRDAERRISDVGPGFGSIEAWTLIELDHCTPDEAAAVRDDVHAAIVGVHRMVDDFPLMRDRMAALIHDDQLLEWIAEQHFVFVGAASYLLGGSHRHASTGDAPRPATLVDGSALGEFRAAGGLDPAVLDPPSVSSDDRVVFARTDAESRYHRAARLTSIAVRERRPIGAAGEEEIEHRFVGLLGSGAYRESVFAIPGVGERARHILDIVGASVESHTGRAVRHVVETLPRDLVFEVPADALAGLVGDIVGLQERRIVRVFDVPEPVGAWRTVLVYVPQARFTAALAEDVTALVAAHYGVDERTDVRDVETLLGTSSLARLSMAVRGGAAPDLAELGAAIDDLSTTWGDRALAALVDDVGEIEARRLYGLIGASVPAEYQARTAPAAAIDDLLNVARLIDAGAVPAGAIRTSFGRHVDAADDEWRFRIFLLNHSVTIAELVPLLAHLGLAAIDEHPAVFPTARGTVYVYDVGVRTAVDTITEAQHAEVQAAFVDLVNGQLEADDLNRLILTAGMTRREVAVLRLYHRYLRQAAFAFSPAYIERAVVENPAIAADLTALFRARFDPISEPDRDAAEQRIRDRLLEQLEAVPSLDDDRILRAFLALIDATVRTNAFVDEATDLAVKLRPQSIAFLPEPRPVHEIFVCSPLVEGVHLRAGAIARGGLRWSDRPEDFRTEILGLVKAQMVKNSVIVPVGAKGGFVVKGTPTTPAERDAWREVGVDRYRRFITALLELTDNVTAEGVAHPDGVVIRDGDDPYLVVAADKGTATFSDIANDIAVSRGFWLGDAFASGGSQGYDHKAMGITARGAWESVRRHARVIGKNVETDQLTAVGVGDMSGDVFGNGMLLSAHLQLVAAFDHRHVFLDPNPDPVVSFDERRRLFELGRSSWDDYDRSLISAGGGVYRRDLKSIPISPEVADALGLDVDALRPNELISAILCAPVDLLWNGGIGTYVKASDETHEMVGDRTNDAVRVDAAQLCCRIVGEGGNLGFTQLARVEYAIAGGLIYTDAIDNSAGVDCSDQEVNIKIALDQLVRDGDLTVKQRNELLVEMTDEVADLVLEHNRAQTLALMIARRQALSMINVHARYLDALEADGRLDRALEALPNDRQINERQSAGSGLRAPEFAVMIAYSKNADIEELLASDVPDDPVLDDDLLTSFPTALRTRFPDAIRAHRLRREIVATRLVNNMVNLAGISFDHRMTEDSGASIADVARAFVASRNIFGFREMWREIDSLSGIGLDAQLELFLDARRLAERGTMWLLRHRRPPLDIGATIDTFAAAIAELDGALDRVVSGHVAGAIAEDRETREAAGVPSDLAARSARWPWMHTGFDIVELADSEQTSLAETATTYWAVFESFDLEWLWDGIGRLPRSTRWQAQARGALRDDLMSVLADLARLVMRSGHDSVANWIGSNERAVGRVIAMHTEIRRAETADLTTLSVAVRQLRNLTLGAAL